MASEWSLWGPPLAAGALSGIVVLIGVVLSQHLRNVRETTVAIEAAAVEVALDLPVFGNLLTRADIDFSFGGQSWTIQQRVKKDIETIEAKTRKRQRKYNELRRVVDEISARIGAAEIRRFRDGIFLSNSEYVSLCDTGLLRAVFREREVLDEIIQKYVKSGLPVD